MLHSLQTIYSLQNSCFDALVSINSIRTVYVATRRLSDDGGTVSLWLPRQICY